MRFAALLLGEHALHGFTNRDLRKKLARIPCPLTPEDKRPGQVTPLLRPLHTPGPVASIPHSRSWRVFLDGRRTMTTPIKLREAAYPTLFVAAT